MKRRTTGLLETAHKYGGTKLKRFVLLSSGVAVLNSFDSIAKPGKPYTEADWNPVTAEYAIKNNDVVAAYNVSKALAEKKAWEFIESAKPAFDLTALLPAVIIGPMLHPISSSKDINSTNAFAVYSLLSGQYKHLDEARYPFYHYVDVRDVSLAHVKGLTTAAASNKRIILVSASITPQLVVKIIQKRFPELKSRLPEGSDDVKRDSPEGVDPTGWDTSRSFEVFREGWKYRELEESVVDVVKEFLKLEEGWKK